MVNDGCYIIYIYTGFLKFGCPKMDGLFHGKFKWMIQEYPCFMKPQSCRILPCFFSLVLSEDWGNGIIIHRYS